MNIEDRALEQIKEAEESLIRLDTQMEGIKETLSTKYGLKTIEEANAFLDKEEIELDRLEKELATKRKELEEGYEWK